MRSGNELGQSRGRPEYPAKLICRRRRIKLFECGGRRQNENELDSGPSVDIEHDAYSTSEHSRCRTSTRRRSSMITTIKPPAAKSHHKSGSAPIAVSITPSGKGSGCFTSSASPFGL